MLWEVCLNNLHIQFQEKVQLHWILHAFGAFSAFFGFASIFLNKEVNNRKHFVSWHAKFGLATCIGVVLTICGGIIAKYSYTNFVRRWIRPINTKLYHATAGMLVFLCAMTTVALACYSNWFKNRVEGWVWRICFWSPLVLALCVARQVTQSYLPRVCAPRVSAIDEKEQRVQEKIQAKLNKKGTAVRDVKKAGTKAKVDVLPQIEKLFNDYDEKTTADNVSS